MASETTILSLSSRPTIISQVLAYLKDAIVVRCDFKAYLALQTSIDSVWAAETRRLMKEPLHYCHVSLALRSEEYLCDHPSICQHKQFLEGLDTKSVNILAEQLAMVHSIEESTAFGLLLAGFWKEVVRRGEKLPRCGPCYVVRQEDLVVRGAKVWREEIIETMIEGFHVQATYTILEDVECCSGEIDEPEHFDVALTRKCIDVLEKEEWEPRPQVADVFALCFSEDGSPTDAVYFYYGMDKLEHVRIG